MLRYSANELIRRTVNDGQRVCGILDHCCAKRRRGALIWFSQSMNLVASTLCVVGVKPSDDVVACLCEAVCKMTVSVSLEVLQYLVESCHQLVPANCVVLLQYMCKGSWSIPVNSSFTSNLLDCFLRAISSTSIAAQRIISSSFVYVQGKSVCGCELIVGLVRVKVRLPFHLSLPSASGMWQAVCSGTALSSSIDKRSAVTVAGLRDFFLFAVAEVLLADAAKLPHTEQVQAVLKKLRSIYSSEQLVQSTAKGNWRALQTGNA